MNEDMVGGLKGKEVNGRKYKEGMVYEERVRGTQEGWEGDG